MSKLRKLDKKMWTFAKLGHRYNISAERVRQIFQENKYPQPSYERMVAEYTNLLNNMNEDGLVKEAERLSAPDRKKTTVIKRRRLTQHLRDKYDYSFSKIASLLKRNHTSISNLYYNQSPQSK